VSGGMMQQGRAMANLRHAGLKLAESLVKRRSSQVQQQCPISRQGDVESQ